MDRRRTGILLCACAALIAVVVLVRLKAPPTPIPPHPSPPAAPTGKPVVAPPATPDQFQPLVEELKSAIAAGERESLLATARRLRDLLLAYPALAADLARLLRDPAAPLALRQAAAVVLGTLPDGKRLLLDALKDGAVAGLERTVLLALGIQAIEDGEIFEREGQPYALELAPGLHVFVSGELTDPEARAELARWLAQSTDPALRLAAARTLRDSTAHAEARQALLERLGTETHGEVIGECGAALAAWTRPAKLDDPERARVVDRLLGVVPASEEIVRFRLTAPVSSTPLNSVEAERVRSLAASPENDTRFFAIEVLGRRIGMSGDQDALAVPVLARSAMADPSPDVREAAALALGRVAKDPQAVQSLTAALRDADWEVRAAAAKSLGQAAGSDAAREALRAATQDPHETVRAVAQKALSILK